MPAAALSCLLARPCAAPPAKLTGRPVGRPARGRAVSGARADSFGGVSRFFAASPRRGEADDVDEAAVRATALLSGHAAFAADAGAAEISALEASLGLSPFSSSATAAIAALLDRAERDAAAKSAEVTPARDAAYTRAQSLRTAVEVATKSANETTKRTLDENQARAEALMRGFADSDADAVIERLRTAAELSAEEVTRTAFSGVPPRRAVITHAVAANERSSVTLQVREWQATELDAAAALAEEYRAPETVQEIAAADAADRDAALQDGGRGSYKRGLRQFKPLFRDYPYETADAV